jgi:hypothetical protein
MPLVNILNPTSISPSSIYVTLGSGLPASPVLTVPTGNFYNIKYSFISVRNSNTAGDIVFSLDASGSRPLISIPISNAAATTFVGVSGNFYLIEGQTFYIRSRPDTQQTVVYPTGAYVSLDIYT